MTDTDAFIAAYLAISLGAIAVVWSIAHPVWAVVVAALAIAIGAVYLAIWMAAVLLPEVRHRG